MEKINKIEKKMLRTFGVGKTKLWWSCKVKMKMCRSTKSRKDKGT